MSILKLRDVSILIYFVVVFFLYLFLIVPGEDSGFYVYFSLIGGAVIVFIVCSLHLFVSNNGYANKVFLFSFFLISIAAAFDFIYHGSTSIVNFLFFLCFSWSVYCSSVRGFREVLNVLFGVSVTWSVVSYYLGINPWGFFPGQTTANLSQGLWWRVGIFPSQTPPFSGALALAVFLVNFGTRGGISKIFLILSLYFLILSGSRTIIIAFLLCVMVYFLSYRVRLRGIPIILIVFGVISFVLAVSSFPFIIAPVFSWNDFLSSLLLRAGGDVEVWEADSRSVILFHFYQYIISYWPFGIGANTLGVVYEGPGVSEMPAVRIVVESGIWGGVALASLALMSLMRSVGSRLFFVMFFVMMFFYGSFLHPYTPVFLAMLCVLNARQWRCEKLGYGR